jgi:hypothetical protein
MEAPFQRSDIIGFIDQDRPGEGATQRSVGTALTNLLNAGFIDRVCHTSGRQSYAQADEWSDPKCVAFLSLHIVRPDDELLPYDPAELLLLKQRVEEENCPNVMMEATRRAVRIMRLNRVYITLAKYAWVPGARALFALEFETATEKVDRISRTMQAIADVDLEAMESLIPATILQP